MKDKKFIIWTSALTLLPVLVGLALWNVLPEELPTHWGFSGGPNGWSSKAFTVLGLPCILLLAHLVCIGGVYLDRRNVGHNKKIMKVILMIFPVLSNVMMALLYNVALGLELNMTSIMMPLLGILFIAMGNYLPKCRQNATLGIKVKWTLYSEENWNRTHRFAGKVWVAVGAAFLFLGFVPQSWMAGLMLALILALAASPTLYSWLLYKKQVKDGTWIQSEGSKAFCSQTARLSKFSAVAILLVVGLIAWVLFSGSIDIQVNGDTMFIGASFWSDLHVDLTEVDRVEYRQEGVSGSREWGFGSLQLLLGTFRNEEFGNYTRYTYAGCGECIILWKDGDVLVINGETPESTRVLYDQIRNRIG